jgi:hypothetical protein
MSKTLEKQQKQVEKLKDVVELERKEECRAKTELTKAKNR